MEAQYTSISVSFASKQELDEIKKEIGAKTYDKAVQYLDKKPEKGLPFDSGMRSGSSGIYPDTRGDSHRVSY